MLFFEKYYLSLRSVVCVCGYSTMVKYLKTKKLTINGD